MNLLILAAGYATRLYPLTLTQPKPLLPVAGKPMVDHVLDNMAGLPGLNRVLIVTNNKFAPHFQQWADAYRASKAKLEFTVINDGSTSDADKLGAIGDLQFVIDREKLDDDLIVVAGDNLFSQPLSEFGTFCKGHDDVVLGVHDVGSIEQAKKYGVVDVDADGRVTSFIEKPDQPASTLIGIALYYYPKRYLGLVRQYLAEGNNPDQPGRLIQWIYPRQTVRSWRIPGIWYDIGSKETLEEANRLFTKL
ncbi:MAG: nucleotidyltransferase family protein [Verrucomicrobiota bacterium]|jgi:glucose-1-phosphate thymidylyltransferase